MHILITHNYQIPNQEDLENIYEITKTIDQMLKKAIDQLNSLYENKIANHRHFESFHVKHDGDWICSDYSEVYKNNFFSIDITYFDRPSDRYFVRMNTFPPSVYEKWVSRGKITINSQLASSIVQYLLSFTHLPNKFNIRKSKLVQTHDFSHKYFYSQWGKIIVGITSLPTNTQNTIVL